MPEYENFEDTLQTLRSLVDKAAQDCGQDCDRLLALLRTLEQLHRRIRTEQFEPALPNTRKGLYGFLRDIEESGGWPYIERGKLQVLMKYLLSEENSTEEKELGR